MHQNWPIHAITQSSGIDTLPPRVWPLRQTGPYRSPRRPVHTPHPREDLLLASGFILRQFFGQLRPLRGIEPATARSDSTNE